MSIGLFFLLFFPSISEKKCVVVTWPVFGVLKLLAYQIASTQNKLSNKLKMIMIRWNLRVKDTQEWEQVGKSQLFYSIFNDFIAFFETTKMHKSTGKLSKIINVAKLNAHRPLITITQSTEYEWHMENIVSHSWHKICPIRWTSDVLARHCIFFVQTLKMPITHSFRRKQRKIQIKLHEIMKYQKFWNIGKKKHFHRSSGRSI